MMDARKPTDAPESRDADGDGDGPPDDADGSPDEPSYSAVVAELQRLLEQWWSPPLVKPGPGWWVPSVRQTLLQQLDEACERGEHGEPGCPVLLESPTGSTRDAYLLARESV